MKPAIALFGSTGLPGVVGTAANDRRLPGRSD